MTRQKTFDEDDMLRRLMIVFWKRGFVGTSYDDITKASGLTKPSLYNAYGDKRSLFLKCLDVYGSTVMKPYFGILTNESVDGVKSVYEFVKNLLCNCDPHFDRSGCLFINTVMESSALRDKVIHTTTRKILADVEKTICSRLLSSKVFLQEDAETTARLIMIGIYGFRLRSKVDEVPHIETSVEQFLKRILKIRA